MCKKHRCLHHDGSKLCFSIAMMEGRRRAQGTGIGTDAAAEPRRRQSDGGPIHLCRSKGLHRCTFQSGPPARL